MSYPSLVDEAESGGATNRRHRPVSGPGEPADLRKTVHELEERVRLLEAVIDNFPGGILLFDRDLNLVLCNERQKRLLEYPDSLFAHGYPTLEQIFRFNASRGEYGPGDVEEHVQMKMALARERLPHVFERTRPNGTILEIRGVPLEGGGFVTTYLDVTDQRKNQAQVAHMAHHDALTGLPNRVLFRDRLAQPLSKAPQRTVALHYLDLDHFKPVNDNFGHATGDALLIAVAERLRATVREGDTVARIGGDEFVVIQVGPRTRSDAAALALRIVNAIASPYEIHGHRIIIGASIGIALAPEHGTDPEELIRKADTALFRSKSDGRGSFRFVA